MIIRVSRISTVLTVAEEKIAVTERC
jgi:hypothetical protein